MYERTLLSDILVFSSLYICMSHKLQLRAPKFALNGTTIKLSCIDSQPPDGNTAEFLVGNKILTNVRIYDETCFNTVQRRACLPTECACAENQENYMMHYHMTQAPDTNVTFSCRMKFDIITVSKAVVTTVIKLKNLSLLDSYSCNSSSPTVLICRNSETKSACGFDDWVHSYVGVFIRTLPGTVDNDVSKLILPTCSYHDYGQYTCRVWYDLGDEDIYEENKTTSLLVEAVPTILDMITTDNACEATYFSKTKISAAEWFENNSTVYPRQSHNVTVTLPIHGVMVKEQGYKSTLLVYERKRPVDLRVCVTNTFGTACKEIKLDEKKEFLDNTKTWILIGACAGGLVIIVAAYSTIIGLSLAKPRAGKHQVTNRTETEQPTPIIENQVEMNMLQFHGNEGERPVHPDDRPIRNVPLPRPPENAAIPRQEVISVLPNINIEVVDENCDYEMVD